MPVGELFALVNPRSQRGNHLRKDFKLVTANKC